MSFANNIQHSSVAEISKSAFEQNWKHLQSKIPTNTQILPMVKSNAYGHGIKILTQLLQNQSIAGLGVANCVEALDLRAIGYKGPILSFGRITPSILQASYENNIWVVIHCLDDLEIYMESACKPICHLEIETGMNRLGLTLNDLQVHAEKFQTIEKYIMGAFSHFTDSENMDPLWCKKQGDAFESAKQTLEKILNKKILTHIGNSGSILHHDEFHMDWVRPGISLYGYHPSGDPSDLRPILTWKAPVIQIKHLQQGDCVGYNRTFTANKPMTIATISVGYGDGFFRSYQSVGVGFQGKRLPIVGNICMDLLMIDITSIPEAKLGDEVHLLGSGDQGEATADEFAKVDQTINYEILSRISSRVLRVLT